MIYDLSTQETFVRAWQAGGMSAAAFCRLHDLPYQLFLLWRKRLAGCSQQSDSVAFVELVPSVGPVASAGSAPPFLPAPDPSTIARALNSAPSGVAVGPPVAPALLVELVLPGGLLLRFFQSVPSSANTATAVC